MFTFRIQRKDGKARAGTIFTDHGVIETPIFMPVGTVGSVKGVLPSILRNDIRAQIILGNTYHLYLRPGLQVIGQAGGLHKFIGWDKPILTDSGGFQVYSLAPIRKITEDGVRFSSHIDGSYHMFSPEKVIDIERVLGSDIMMVLDECPPYGADKAYVEQSMNLTHRWLERSIKHFQQTSPLYGHQQVLFPIVQGGTFTDLRTISAQFVAEKNMDGNAIGGLAVGEPEDLMYEMVELTCSILPENKPRYLMGVGTPANILHAIALGVDMFDCVIPTRNGRNAWLYTWNGIINIRNKKWQHDYSCLDENSPLELDRTISKAYLRHLFVANELLAPIIASIHNLFFFMELVRTARKHILNNTFSTWYKSVASQCMQKL